LAEKKQLQLLIARRYQTHIESASAASISSTSPKHNRKHFQKVQCFTCLLAS